MDEQRDDLDRMEQEAMTCSTQNNTQLKVILSRVFLLIFLGANWPWLTKTTGK